MSDHVHTDLVPCLHCIEQKTHDAVGRPLNVPLTEAKVGNTSYIYRRGDGGLIAGEYGFTAELEWWEDGDEGGDVFRETWLLIKREVKNFDRAACCDSCEGDGSFPICLHCGTAITLHPTQRVWYHAGGWQPCRLVSSTVIATPTPCAACGGEGTEPEDDWKEV